MPRTMGMNDEEVGSSRSKRSRHETVEEILLPQVHYEVLTEDVVRSLSAPIYCRDLDTTTLRDLIDSDGKLIPEDPQPGVPRVGIPRPPRASMQDLYDRMGRMEIRHEPNFEGDPQKITYGLCQRWTAIGVAKVDEKERAGTRTESQIYDGSYGDMSDAIERMEYRQSYHWDRYHGVFEHMARVYSVSVHGAYNPPGYAQPQYDQLTTTFITFRVEKEEKFQEVEVASVTIVNCCLVLERHCRIGTSTLEI
ncbi:hypothetical protein Tco_0465128 [Tanacetum coccineum]